MAAPTTGFKTNPNARSFVHATTAPDPTNIGRVGDLWTVTGGGAAGVYVCTATVGATSTWTKMP